jgi:hypothetical protein
MIKANINGTEIEYSEEMSLREVRECINQYEIKFKQKLKSISIEADGEFVNVNYEFYGVPFDRIRRITGYLTGNTSTWNDSKAAEEKDRVKHESKMERI